MQFRPIVAGALYPGISRGLKADILASQALGGNAYPICTSHIVAGRGVVTDVLNVPTDTVSAQFEHLANTEQPTAAKVGVMGNESTVEMAFEHLSRIDGPVILDLTLSGPSGEDVIGERGISALLDHLDQPDLVTVRKTDAALIAGMEIPSLDDAQVAVQRIAQQGAEHVLLRCGQLPTHFYDDDGSPPEYAVDLYYDGEDIALFEAPYLSDLDELHGASSGLLLPLLEMMQSGATIEAALQRAKGRVTEALRVAQEEKEDMPVSQVFFAALQRNSESQNLEVDDLIDR